MSRLDGLLPEFDGIVYINACNTDQPQTINNRQLQRQKSFDPQNRQAQCDNNGGYDEIAEEAFTEIGDEKRLDGSSERNGEKDYNGPTGQ